MNVVLEKSFVSYADPGHDFVPCTLAFMYA